jgi:hypothetical protein
MPRLLVLLLVALWLGVTAPAVANPYGASGGEALPEDTAGATAAPDDPTPQAAPTPRATPEPAQPTAAPAAANPADTGPPAARTAQTPVEPEPGVPGGGEHDNGASDAPPRAEPQGDAPGTSDSGGLPMSGAQTATVFVVGVLLFGLGLAGVAIARGRSLSKY